MATRRGELLGPYEIVPQPLARGTAAEWVQRYGADHPFAVAHVQLRAYTTGVPTFMGCSGFLLRHDYGVPAYRVGICYRPPRHDGDHRYILVSSADSERVKSAAALWARSTAPEEDAHG